MERLWCAAISQSNLPSTSKFKIITEQSTHGVCPCSFSIIFLRAARIISSRRFWSRRCRSSLFWDQELLEATAGDASELSPAAFALRLYRDIKSCPSAFGVEEVVVGCVVGLVAEGIAIWGWNDGGG